MQMNKHGMLIMHLIAVTSIGNKTKHTYTKPNNPKLHSNKQQHRTSEFFCLNIRTLNVGNFM